MKKNQESCLAHTEKREHYEQLNNATVGTQSYEIGGVGSMKTTMV